MPGNAPSNTRQLFPIGSFRKQWQTSCVASGLGHWKDPERKQLPTTGLIIHDLQRSVVRNMIAAGVNDKVAMRISGHKTRAIFDRFHGLSADDLHRAINRVEAPAKALSVPGAALPTGKLEASSLRGCTQMGHP
jgi:hypothetical protein